MKSSRHCTEVLMAALTVVNPFLSRPWKCRGTCYGFETYLTSFPEPVRSDHTFFHRNSIFNVLSVRNTTEVITDRHSLDSKITKPFSSLKLISQIIFFFFVKDIYFLNLWYYREDNKLQNSFLKIQEFTNLATYVFPWNFFPSLIIVCLL